MCGGKARSRRWDFPRHNASWRRWRKNGPGRPLKSQDLLTTSTKKKRMKDSRKRYEEGRRKLQMWLSPEEYRRFKSIKDDVQTDANAVSLEYLMELYYHSYYIYTVFMVKHLDMAIVFQYNTSIRPVLTKMSRELTNNHSISELGKRWCWWWALLTMMTTRLMWVFLAWKTMHNILYCKTTAEGWCYHFMVKHHPEVGNLFFTV